MWRGMTDRRIDRPRKGSFSRDLNPDWRLLGSVGCGKGMGVDPAKAEEFDRPVEMGRKCAGCASAHRSVAGFVLGFGGEYGPPAPADKAAHRLRPATRSGGARVELREGPRAFPSPQQQRTKMVTARENCVYKPVRAADIRSSRRPGSMLGNYPKYRPHTILASYAEGADIAIANADRRSDARPIACSRHEQFKRARSRNFLVSFANHR
jgi:hypothetical protein